MIYCMHASVFQSCHSNRKKKRKYKLYNQTLLAASNVILNTPKPSYTCPSSAAVWLLSQWPELLMWCKMNATRPWQWGCHKCLLHWPIVTLCLRFHHAGQFTEWPCLQQCAAAADSQAEMLAMEAEVSTGVMAKGQGWEGDVIYLPLTAYRLSIKWVGSCRSDCRGISFNQGYTANCGYNCVCMLWISLSLKKLSEPA